MVKILTQRMLADVSIYYEIEINGYTLQPAFDSLPLAIKFAEKIVQLDDPITIVPLNPVRSMVDELRDATRRTLEHYQ